VIAHALIRSRPRRLCCRVRLERALPGACRALDSRPGLPSGADHAYSYR